MVDTAPTRKRTRKAGREKPEILEAAVRVIIERGVERTRFADVSDATGVPIASLQYYFGSREDLLIAAFRHGSEACVGPRSRPVSRPCRTRGTGSSTSSRPTSTPDDPDASDQALLLSEESIASPGATPALRLDLLDEYNAWRSMISEAISSGWPAASSRPTWIRSGTRSGCMPSWKALPGQWPWGTRPCRGRRPANSSASTWTPS